MHVQGKDTVKRIALTQGAVDDAIAQHTRGKRERHWFTRPVEMYLQITPNGCASYCVRYQRPSGGKGDFTLGQVSRITTRQAEAKAAKELSRLTLDLVDPVEARRDARRDAKERKARTFQALSVDFMAAAENRKLAARTVSERQWVLDKHILPRLGGRPVEDLRVSDIRACVRSVQEAVQGGKRDDEGASGNRMANVAHGLMRRVFNWAIEEGRCEANPAAFRKIFADQPEKRIGALTDNHLREIWLALDGEAAKGWGPATALAIQICLVTLQRPNEVVTAHKDDFDWGAKLWRVPASKTKTKATYEVPLSDFAVELFKRAFVLSRSPWAFPADCRKRPLAPNALSHRFAKMRRRLVKAKLLPTGDIQLYDGRRFGRTRLVQKLGVSEHVAERVINHAPDRSMARRYDVGDYTGEVRRAHNAWTNQLRLIVFGEPLPKRPAPERRPPSPSGRSRARSPQSTQAVRLIAKGGR
jgi:integrase